MDDEILTVDPSSLADRPQSSYATEYAQDDLLTSIRGSTAGMSPAQATSYSSAAAAAAAHTSIFQVTTERKAKRVRFYRNGDRFFAGLIFAVSQERYRTLDSLMADLTESPVCDRRILPQGVRHIFALDGTRRISSVSQLEEGHEYVCSSTPTFRKTDYPRSGFAFWNMNRGSVYHLSGSLSSRLTESPVSAADDGLGPVLGAAERDFVRPRLVIILRNGGRPRKCFRLLLNRKTAHSLEQVLADITKTIKLDNGNVRKVFAISGKQVTNLRDFFGDDQVYLAYGQERPSADDFHLSESELQQISMTGRFVVRQQSQQPNVSRGGTRTPRRMLSSASSRSLNRDNGAGEHPITHGPGRVPPFTSRTSKRVRSPTTTTRSSTLKSPVSSRIDSKHSHVVSHALEPRQLRIKYKIGRVIGKGNFAIVKECTEKARKLRFALKIVNRTKCQGRERMIDNEVSILRRIKHPNIVQLMDEFHTPDMHYLIMELITGGDLFDSIAAANKYSERDASGMTYHLASAICYLHSLNIVHRDIKPENLLVHERADGFKSLKLGDFGLATEVREPLFTVCGTPTYIAPEVVAETGYGLKVDVWAAGVIVYILLCGFPPFSSTTNDTEELFDKILSGKFEFLEPYWSNISTSAKDLIVDLLQVDVDKRLSAEELLEYPWVAEDVARENDIHSSVASRIIQFAKSGKNEQHHQQRQQQEKPTESAVAVITETALDKGCRYFCRRKLAQSPNRQENGDEV